MAEDAATRPWFIYGLYDPREGLGPHLIRYVGKADDVPRRLRGHVSGVKQSRDTNPYKSAWIQSLLDAGVEPAAEVLEQGQEDSWAEAEVRNIAYWRSITGKKLTNLTDGGEGATGWVPSEETLVRMRVSHQGKKWTSEHKAAISAARKGMKFSADHKAALSAAHQGRVCTEETRAKISAVQKGRKGSGYVCSEETRAKLSSRVISEATRAKQRNRYTPEVRAALSAARKGIKRPPEVVAKILATKAQNRAERKRLAQGDTIEAFVAASGISFDTDDRPVKARLR